MGQEEQQTQQNAVARLAQEIAALSGRVAAIERHLTASGAVVQDQPSREAAQVPPPPPKPVLEQVPQLSSKPASSLEKRIGSQIFNRIGIIALLIAAALFLKHAMDNHWIGPLGRVLIGLVAGSAIVLWSERFRRKGFDVFSYSLKAIGSGVLYLALWAAFQVFHLMPAGVALAAMVLVTAWNALMAWSQSSELLAIYALAGAFATPLLLATGGNHETFLFTYILVIDIATVALVRLKPWQRLLLGAFPATIAFFVGWYVQFNSSTELAVTSLFVALFFVIFIVPSIDERDERKGHSQGSAAIASIFLPLANAVFLALAFYSLLEDSGHHALLPWMAVLFGALYLGLMRLPQARVTFAVHLSLAVVFLTIAIPLKASGNWITVGWFAEGVALLWIAARMMTSTTESTAISSHRVLRVLALCALLLGFFSLSSPLVWLGQPGQTAFLNLRFATSLFGIAALAASTWIALRASTSSDVASPSWRTIVGFSIIALNLVAISACVHEIDTAFHPVYGNVEAVLQRSLIISGFLMLYGAALLAVGFWKRSAFIRWQAIILLVFTIGKTFIYDLRDLSQGYRVISFLGLGVLLMVVSFAYQKDWLAFRASEPEQPHSSEPTTGVDQ
ncbi:hypothetical protein GCM10011507_17620 [Edaphobacter acidisoli]|uniref:DUF2339 domain-containing protein n=1 Tax=Edaphobacter acidisoli TaxID=2040573 RepID=A0A916RR98_9BACT|nr:hypothetical protein GCM10011507_17620 [Edaphobacter acidisoli]